MEGSPLAARIAEPVYARIKDRARTALRAFEVPGGTVHAPLTCHIVLAHPG